MMPAMAADGAEEERGEGGARVIAISSRARPSTHAGSPERAPRPALGAGIDRALLERHRAGDPEAFPALVAAFRAPVFGYLTRCGVRPADRDDLFQEAFLRVHRAASPGASSELPTGPVAPWLFTIVVNLVRSHFRKATVRKGTTLDNDAQERAVGGEVSPERALETREQLAWLESAMEKLPLEQREALVLAGIEGLELAEAAAVLEVPVDTVKTRVRRARLALAEARVRAGVVAAREEGR